jgi:hypothetical protein
LGAHIHSHRAREREEAEELHSIAGILRHLANSEFLHMQANAAGASGPPANTWNIHLSRRMAIFCW